MSQMQEGIEFANINVNDMFVMGNIDFIKRYSNNVIADDCGKAKKNVEIAKEITQEKLETAKRH